MIGTVGIVADESASELFAATPGSSLSHCGQRMPPGLGLLSICAGLKAPGIRHTSTRVVNASWEHYALEEGCRATCRFGAPSRVHRKSQQG